MANQNQKKPHEDFSLKETTPNIAAGRVISGDRLPTAFDLVEQMHFLFVRVVRARELSVTTNSHTCSPYVEVRLGSFIGTTRFFEKIPNPEWNQVFAFAKDRIQELVLEILVKDKANNGNKGVMGRVSFSVSDIPMRVPPDSPLAPQWYRLEDQNGVKLKRELMLSVWMGTQADEAFPYAFHTDAAAATSGDNIAYTRSKVYISPRLWYLRVNVIQAQDLLLKNKNENSDIFIQAVLGNLALRSRPVKISPNPIWNEDLMFVAAEPFDESLVLSLEQGNSCSNKHEKLGICEVHLKNVERRIDAATPASKWYNLEKPKKVQECEKTNKATECGEEAAEKEQVKFSTKLNMRISLDGGYHVLDETTQYSSDLRPASKKLSKMGIGVLELGILNAKGLSPMKKENRTDAYCVAKYGPKWVRTRTIVDSLSPKWNEQYTWEVYDPCTVITIVVFDNNHLQAGKTNEATVDQRIGKVRIRLSTLESDRIYTHFYPLINLQPQGAKKMGEIQLAVRFSCPSLLNVLQTYAQPMLPKMHYICPLSMFQLDSLRNQAAVITSLRLSRAEPPLKREVVEYMLDVRANVWSMRRGRAQFHRILSLLSGLVSACKLFDEIRSWKSTVISIIAYFIFLLAIIFPEKILPTTFFLFLVKGIWRYRSRPRHPTHMDVKLSHADTTTIEELEEEFDPFPSKFSGENLRKRYDRLRGIAGRLVAVMGDLATQGERAESLLRWRDPRGTALFVIFCLVGGIVSYAVPFRVWIVVLVSYVMRPPSQIESNKHTEVTPMIFCFNLEIVGDGRCLFRSIVYGASLRSENFVPSESVQTELADDLRAKVADEFVKRKEESQWFIEGDFDTYVSEIRKSNVWGGEPELLMASHVLQMPIVVYMKDGYYNEGFKRIAEYGQELYGNENPIMVVYNGSTHYDALTTQKEQYEESEIEEVEEEYRHHNLSNQTLPHKTHNYYKKRKGRESRLMDEYYYDQEFNLASRKNKKNYLR
ncbi:FT-interacting protein 1-like [Senna tora]|uniref:FT-interacting protein 1-like n=1 Tax=Senna tora TaxID=362788 RepID=A0A834WMB2_9FABA|nr:FT-interacting protein 1-like [Senna tora]